MPLSQFIKWLVFWAVVTAVLVVLCYFFVDRQFALWTYALDAKHQLHRLSPQLTLPFVKPGGLYWACAIVFVLCCCINHFFKRYRFVDMLTLMSVSVFVALMVKSALKFTFSRYSEQAFLHAHQYGFVWFHNYQSFPSGHMTILTAALMTVWLYWPKLRVLVVAGLVVEALTLVTNFNHFISDIIAGVYVGTVITLVLYRCYRKIYP